MKNHYTSYRNIFSIAWPILLGSLGQNIIYLVDTSFLGRVSEYDLGASAIGGIFYFLLFMIGYALNTGMQVIVARRKGEKRDHEIGEVVDHQFRIILIVALLDFILMRFFAEGALLMMKSEIIKEKAVEFLHYRSYGIFFGLINSLFMSFFIGIGNTRVTIWTTGVMVAVNIFLLYCLVFGNLGFPRMEIAGAGLASSIAEASVTVVMIIYLFRKKFIREYDLFRFLKTRTSLLWQMLKLSGPLVFQQLISVGSWWLFFRAIERIGERELAVSNLIRSLYTMYGVPVWALASTTSSMVSNLMGQGKPNDIFLLLKKISLISISMAMIFGIVVLLFPSAVLSIFTNDKNLISASIPTLYTVIAAVSLFSVSILTIFAVSGTGATNISLRIEITCIVAYMIYIYFTAVRIQCSLPVIWLAEVVYWIIALTLCVYYLKYGNWRTKTV